MQLTIATKIQGLQVTLVMCHSSTVPSVVMRVSFGLNIILGGVFEFGDVDVVIVVVIVVSVVAVAAISAERGINLSAKFCYTLKCCICSEFLNGILYT